ncbi:hypothetical protein [Streptomyces azureus]|uniref:Serine/threonine protein kinase n=1 Tax=Streptomyces azureus TaxID=146537 RepID=A0A0K8PHP6_STRAJ|nr:hypothetical protein [Streptomyces azureus]GAP46914.1 serine/threonine protein kinase [Streptomyces azureus]
MGDPRWLNEPIAVPRWITLSFAAIAVVTVVNWALAALLWILQHLPA